MSRIGERNATTAEPIMRGAARSCRSQYVSDLGRRRLDSSIGASWSSHDHHSHQDPSSAGAAYTASDRCETARFCTSIRSFPFAASTRELNPRTSRSIARSLSRLTALLT